MDQEKFYKSMIENLFDGIYFVDKDRKILIWNKGAEIITGYSSSEVKGRFCYDNILNHVNSEGCELCHNGCPLQKTNDDGISREADVFLHHKDGHRIPVSIKSIAIYDGDEIVGSIEVFRDNTEHSEILKDLGEFRNLALNDQLTGLPNRRYLTSFLDSKMNEYNSLGIPFGIAFLDIDKFKIFNDTYGHETGDEVLKMVAKTFSTTIRSTDIVGRWGGEEFVGVFAGVNEDNLLMLTEKIRVLIASSSIKKEENSLNVTISIGATIFKDDDTIESALNRADELLYKSKENGRNKVTIG